MLNTLFVCATRSQKMNFVSVQMKKNDLDGTTPRKYVLAPMHPSEGKDCDMPDILYMLDHLCDSLLRTIKSDKPVWYRNDLRGSTPHQYLTSDVIRVGEAKRNQYTTYPSFQSLCGEYWADQLE